MIEIPENLRRSIQDQIIESSARGERGWRFSRKDEDSLLGDYLGSLRSDRRIFLTIDKEYEWEILYHKIQGRGPNAYEKHIGADAIITFEIVDKLAGERTVKSLIFQAKKEGNGSGVAAQKNLVDNIAKGGNLYIFMRPEWIFCSNGNWWA